MLNLLSVNIEGKRHLDKIERLIGKVRPDVICMQEVFEDDIPRLVQTLEHLHRNPVTTHFSPILLKTFNDTTGSKVDEKVVKFGNLILTPLPHHTLKEQYYFGSRENLKMHQPTVFSDLALVVLSVVVKKDGDTFQVATTHFCKNHDGSVTSDFQREQAVGLLQSLDQLGDFIACGDFNAPRGGEIFTMLAERYKDNIDPSYTTSLDPDLHRAGPLPYMVDGLFTTPEYVVTHMHFETGVSDHYAIVATIERAAQ